MPNVLGNGPLPADLIVRSVLPHSREQGTESWHYAAKPFDEVREHPRWMNERKFALSPSRPINARIHESTIKRLRRGSGDRDADPRDTARRGDPQTLGNREVMAARALLIATGIDWGGHRRKSLSTRLPSGLRMTSLLGDIAFPRSGVPARGPRTKSGRIVAFVSRRCNLTGVVLVLTLTGIRVWIPLTPAAARRA